MKVIEEAINDFETLLGISSGFFYSLLEEDDWSFIIKSHALIESACSELLSAYFGLRNLENIFARLELGEKETGKLAFLINLELLTADERRFISEFSKLRNKLVHNVKNINFVLIEHFENLDSNQKRSFVNAFGIYCTKDSVNLLVGEELYKEMRSNPKLQIWRSLKYLIGAISLQIKINTLNHETRKNQNKVLAAMKKSNKSLKHQSLRSLDSF